MHWSARRVSCRCDAAVPTRLRPACARVREMLAMTERAAQNRGREIGLVVEEIRRCDEPAAGPMTGRWRPSVASVWHGHFKA
jgi:hypothetical protein